MASLADFLLLQRALQLGPSSQPVPAETIGIADAPVLNVTTLPPPVVEAVSRQYPDSLWEAERAAQLQVLEQDQAKLREMEAAKIARDAQQAARTGNVLPVSVENDGSYSFAPVTAFGGGQAPPGTMMTRNPQFPQLADILQSSPGASRQAPEIANSSGRSTQPAFLPGIKPPAEDNISAMKSFLEIVTPQKTEVPPAMQPPATLQDAQRRTIQWKGILDRLQNPDNMAALQTFFAALSAPMAPWETGWSRFGRAAQMFNLHKAMLEGNAENRPEQDRLREMELRKAEAGVRKEEAEALRFEAERRFNEKTFDTRVSEAKERLKNLMVAGQINDLERQLKAEEFKIAKEIGHDKAKLAIQKLRAELATEYERARATRELGDLRKRTPGSAGSSSKSLKPVDQMSAEEAAEEINALRAAFYGSGLKPEGETGFIDWVKENYNENYNVRLNELMRKIRAAGGTVTWKPRDKSESSVLREYETGKKYRDPQTGQEATYLGNGMWEDEKGQKYKDMGNGKLEKVR